MSQNKHRDIKENLIIFLKEYLLKSGANGFVLGMSGGLDSAVVATLCKLATPNKTHALLMPTRFSNEKNLKDGADLCKKLNITYDIVSIQPILDSFSLAINENLNKTRLGNLSARIRMSLLYDYSAKHGLLVVGTSNKSERMLGYGTIYGDLACALNPIGNIYKSEIFEFARYLNIDEEIVKKAPSADLWEGQSDEADLGYSYEVLDEVLKFIDKVGFDEAKIYENFKDRDLVDLVFKRIKTNKFKQEMPKIAQI